MQKPQRPRPKDGHSFNIEELLPDLYLGYTVLLQMAMDRFSFRQDLWGGTSRVAGSQESELELAEQGD